MDALAVNDDPFALDDDDRTVLRPSTARGAGRAAPAGPVPGGDRPPPAERADAIAGDAPDNGRMPLLGGINPLERVASRILPLLVSIRHSDAEPDVARLRERLLRELEAFKRGAREVLEEPAQVTQASYVLCTALDEAVMRTPWGHRANWAQHSLLERFHNEVTGGERFFSLLKSLGRDPERNRAVLELMYVVLALGYEGSYRIARDGQATLARVREWLHGTLGRGTEPVPSALSTRWEGTATRERVLPRFAGASLAALAALAIATAVWVTLRLDTARRTEAAVASFWPLAAAPFEARRVAPPLPTPAPTTPADAPPRPTLTELLAADIDAGAVVVDESPLGARVRIVGDALFASGRAALEAGVAPLVGRIGRALAPFEGEIVVTGHTDRVPVRSGRWGSNLELSLARAESVLAELERALPPGRAVRAEGRGSLEPLNDGSTPALRRENRRVDVTIRYR